MEPDLIETDMPGLVAIGAEGRLLVLHRAGGPTQVTAVSLREACRCAGCTAARRLGAAVAPAADVRITGAAPIGGYGLNLGFSDGHARGVFPFAYLAELATERAA